MTGGAAEGSCKGMKIGMPPALLLILGMPASALIPGAWEPFTTKTNALAWVLEDFGDPDFLYEPTWSDGENPFIGSFMIADGISLFADAVVGEGAFTGDYAAADVESIEIYVYLEDPTRVDQLDFAIRSEVGGGDRYYFTESFFGDEFSGPGWYPMEFWLDDVWFYWDDDWVEVALTPLILSNITEIAISFYPVEGNAAETVVGIDDVWLKHRLNAPPLGVEVAAGTVSLSFPTEPAHWYMLEEFVAATEMWEVVDGQEIILGPDPFEYSFPAGDGGLFRAVAEHDFTEVVTPGL